MVCYYWTFPNSCLRSPSTPAEQQSKATVVSGTGQHHISPYLRHGIEMMARDVIDTRQQLFAKRNFINDCMSLARNG